MITNTAGISTSNPTMKKQGPVFRAFLSLTLLFAAAFWAQASPVFGPWTPIFKGIDHGVGTNNPNIAGNFPNEWQVVHCVRVDLTDPDIQLFTTPRASSYVAESRETLTQTVPGILQQYKLQVASDGNFYNANPGGSDPTSAGVNCEVYGLQISSGIVVSAETSADYSGDPRAASLLFTTNKQPMFVFKNLPPGTNTTGIYTAITGFYPIVSNGVNIGAASISAYPDSWIHLSQPRTAFGISQNGRYLYLMTIDGRQSGYSDGALDSETAYWMFQCGAWNAINMDGGGSTALYMADSTGNPVALNHSSYLPGYGRERYIGSHFGVFAKPVPGFFTNVLALPDDTAATITWTTISPATTQLKYGLTTNLNLTTTLNSALVTNHAVLLTNLSPATGYYFAALGTIGTNQYTSSNLFFVTTNYVTTTTLFDFANIWNYMTANLDGVAWMARGYDDSSWTGSGPGVLWADDRGPNANIPIALGTEMPWDPNTGFPFYTYYFRTHFAFTNTLSGVALQFETYIDDGAVFYLNGTEIYRLRMAAAPTVIYNATLAIGYACSGDATCPYDVSLSGPVITTNLVVGDNVLAVEVHNYNAQSPDITFGLSAACTVPYISKPKLDLACSSSVVTLSWSQGGYTLQQANAITGAWSDVPGPVISSPFTTNNSGAARFFRLRK
jgi:exopolysaccharide biosynthesis protein